MKHYSLYFFLALISCKISAQEVTVKKLQSEVTRSIKKPNDTTAWTWKRGGEVSVNLTQGSLSNWASGGDKFSLALNSHVNYFLLFKKGKQNWDNNLDFNFGMIKSTGLGTRKNDDRFDLLSKYGYNINHKWYLTGLLSFRTQFFNGYSYPSNKPRIFSSTFLSPAYVLFSQGMDFKPNSHLSAFISPITSRWVIVANKALSDSGQYGVPRGEHAITEWGAFVSVNYNNTFNKNISYKGRIDLFSNYRNHPENIDVYCTNYFAFKINKFLSATYNLDLIYDDDVRIFGEDRKSARLQLKSMAGVGFLMRL